VLIRHLRVLHSINTKARPKGRPKKAAVAAKDDFNASAYSSSTADQLHDVPENLCTGNDTLQKFDQPEHIDLQTISAGSVNAFSSTQGVLQAPTLTQSASYYLPQTSSSLVLPGDGNSTLIGDAVDDLNAVPLMHGHTVFGDNGQFSMDGM
jgi:hypothetical protein